jgi:intracellular sulfur oxidation DsrE/DsrF family protein
MTARRSFLARLGVAAAAFGVGSAASVHAQSAAPAGPFQPARHDKDAWFDQIPGKHRVFFDVVSPQGVADAIQFTDNTIEANKTGYGLEASDLALVVCLRHMATPFAFGDALWAKYGAQLGEALKVTDPKTGVAPVINTRRAALEELAKRGVHFAVCDFASHRFAGMVARRNNTDADAVYKEMVASVMPNSTFVPAGIVAVNRSQEHGYALAYVG